jgi:uncharacterized protein
MSVFGLPGGAMIGLAAGVLLIFNKDLLGASGIIASVCLSPQRTLEDPKQHWRFVFVAAFLLLDTCLLARFYDYEFDHGLTSWAYAVGGFLTGLGTKLGGGCTSGHGICGLARLSKHSFVAVMTFMTWAVFTATICYGVPAFSVIRNVLVTDDPWDDHERWMYVSYVITGLFTLFALYVVVFWTSKSRLGMKKLIPGAMSGLLFCGGLYISRMVYKTRVISFLDVTGFVDGSWDPTLVYVMGVGLIFSFISYQWVNGYEAFTLTSKAAKPPVQCDTCGVANPQCGSTKKIDTQFLIGAALFGIGWGIAGICPGPAIFLAGAGQAAVIVIWWPAFFLGYYIGIQIVNYRAEAAERIVTLGDVMKEDSARQEETDSETHSGPAVVDVAAEDRV